MVSDAIRKTREVLLSKAELLLSLYMVITSIWQYQNRIAIEAKAIAHLDCKFV